LLASCYRRALVVASELGARSIAFPAISTGIYGYPAADAAEVAVATIRSTADSVPLGVEEVRLVAFDRPTLERYQELLAR
jgi:O-acetyl-ADP-ribose deacetylase (regulator of RNase III)